MELERSVTLLLGHCPMEARDYVLDHFRTASYTRVDRRVTLVCVSVDENSRNYANG